MIDDQGWLNGGSGALKYRLRVNGDQLASGAGSTAAFVPFVDGNGPPPTHGLVYHEAVVPLQSAFEHAAALVAANSSSSVLRTTTDSDASQAAMLPWYS